jgi:hypothetical protein
MPTLVTVARPNSEIPSPRTCDVRLDGRSIRKAIDVLSPLDSEGTRSANANPERLCARCPHFI